jgi:hypothetical protein
MREWCGGGHQLSRRRGFRGLWCGVVWCGVVWCGVVWCGVLCCAVLCCAVLCCGMVWCGVLCCSVLCCAVLCCAVLCCAVLCCGVVRCVTWCSVLCNTLGCGRGAARYAPSRWQVLYDVFLPSAGKATAPGRQQREPDCPRCNELLTHHPVSTAHIVPCLIGLYGDVEHTGFYDKLGHRYRACAVAGTGFGGAGTGFARGPHAPGGGGGRIAWTADALICRTAVRQCVTKNVCPRWLFCFHLAG